MGMNEASKDVTIGGLTIAVVVLIIILMNQALSIDNIKREAIRTGHAEYDENLNFYYLILLL